MKELTPFVWTEDLLSTNRPARGRPLFGRRKNVREGIWVWSNLL